MDDEERSLEVTAMNIVHQIGDALYDALPKDIAHDHFVDARQKTNDLAIDFAKKLIKSRDQQIALAAQTKAAVSIRSFLAETDSGRERYAITVCDTYIESNEAELATFKAQENQDV